MGCKCNNHYDHELSESGLYERVHFSIEFESKHPLKCDHQVPKEHGINNFSLKGYIEMFFLVALNARKECNREEGK